MECPDCLCRTCKCDLYAQEAADIDVVDEDWLAGVSCNPNAPEECESCQ